MQMFVLSIYLWLYHDNSWYSFIHSSIWYIYIYDIYIYMIYIYIYIYMIYIYIYDIYIYDIYIWYIYIYIWMIYADMYAGFVSAFWCRCRGEAELRGGEALRPELEASTELIQALSRAREEREDCLNGWDSIAPYSPNWSSSLGNFDEENWFLSSTFNFRTFSKTNSMVN